MSTNDRILKKIKGKHLVSGEVREYEFCRMDVETGLEIFHNFVGTLATLFPYFSSLLDVSSTNKEDTITIGADDDGNPTMVDRKVAEQLMITIPKMIPWSSVGDLTKKMLVGSSITANGETFKADSNGYCELAIDDPSEHYMALLYCACINYPKHLLPFLEELGTE